MSEYIHNGVKYSNDWLPSVGDRVTYIKVGSLSPFAVNGVEGPNNGDICTVDRKHNFVDCQNWVRNGTGPYQHELYLGERTRFWRKTCDPANVVPPPGYGVQPVSSTPQAQYQGPTVAKATAILKEVWGQKPAETKVAMVGGCVCKRCNQKNEYAAANQKDGSYLCYECR